MQDPTEMHLAFPAAMPNTPTTKLLNQLSRLLATMPPTPDSKYIILIQTGSHSPIHLVHLRVFNRAREHIEATVPNTHVIAGFISPSHDIYVSKKLGREAIPGNHRIAMARLAASSSDWVDVDSWESSSQDDFVDFPGVALHLQEQLRSADWPSLGIAKEQVEVWYLGGADVFLRVGVQGLLSKGIHPVCVFRAQPGHCETYDEFLTQMSSRYGSSGYTANSMIILDGRDGNPDLDNLSSSMVRRRLARGAPVDTMVDPDVCRYLKENKILQ